MLRHQRSLSSRGSTSVVRSFEEATETGGEEDGSQVEEGAGVAHTEDTDVGVDCPGVVSPDRRLVSMWRGRGVWRGRCSLELPPVCAYLLLPREGT
jgi:hypothetical protein